MSRCDESSRGPPLRRRVKIVREFGPAHVGCVLECERVRVTSALSIKRPTLSLNVSQCEIIIQRDVRFLYSVRDVLRVVIQLQLRHGKNRNAGRARLYSQEIQNGHDPRQTEIIKSSAGVLSEHGMTVVTRFTAALRTSSRVEESLQPRQPEIRRDSRKPLRMRFGLTPPTSIVSPRSRPP